LPFRNEEVTDRIPNDAGAGPPPPEDTTARVVGRILNTKPKVAVGNVGANGMFRFTLFYHPLRITPQDIRHMTLLRRSVLADFLGRFLILTNLDDFLPLLTECDFSYHVRRYPIQQMGLYLDDYRLTFECNIAVMYRLLNEEMAKSILGEQAKVKWSWDFFRRESKNPAH
jgi:hypothetical protein